MASNVLFLVHGMGWNLEPSAQGEPWYAEVDKALRDAWQLFPSLKQRKLDTYIELVPLHYDKVFRDYVEQLAQGANALQAALGDAEYAKLASAIAGAGADEETFFWANVMDVLLYRFGGDRFRAAHVALGKQIAEKVRQVWADVDRPSTQFSVLSHSLGTAVIHGTLNRLGGGRIAGTDVLMLGGNFKLRAYITLANVSRVLWSGDGSIYDRTIVRPATHAVRAGYVDSFVNVRHACDPIPAPLRFSPTTWGDAYREIELRHLRDANVHGFVHYLSHPRVAGAVLQPLVPAGLLTDAEIDAVAAQYRDVALTSAAEIARVEQVLARIAQSLVDAYADEANLAGDSLELVAKVVRAAWRSRFDLQAAIKAVG